jgi:hypothetical protein
MNYKNFFIPIFMGCLLWDAWCLEAAPENTENIGTERRGDWVFECSAGGG